MNLASVSPELEAGIRKNFHEVQEHDSLNGDTKVTLVKIILIYYRIDLKIQHLVLCLQKIN